MGNKFDEYMENPESLPTDEEAVEEFLKSMEDTEEPAPVSEEEAAAAAEAEGDADVTATDKDDSDAKAKAEAEAKGADTKDDDSGKDDDNQTQPVIKTRDGKHEIPYSVLEAAREEARKLRTKLDQYEKEREQLERDKPAPTTDNQDTATSSDKDEFDLDAFREEFGDEAAEAELKRRKELDSIREKQQRLEQELAANKEWREQQERQTKQEQEKAEEQLQKQVDEAIDSVPVLREWMNAKDPMWDAAVALDNRLRDDPAYRDYSLQQRFEAVVEKLTGQKPNPKPEDLEKDVDKKLAAKDAADRSAPNSLSDIPGGVQADQSDSDSLERMTTGQLEAKLAKMSAEDVEAYLARL